MLEYAPYLNLVCCIISAVVSRIDFEEESISSGWLNLFASAINAGIFLKFLVS